MSSETRLPPLKPLRYCQYQILELRVDPFVRGLAGSFHRDCGVLTDELDPWGVPVCYQHREQRKKEWALAQKRTAEEAEEQEG